MLGIGMRTPRIDSEWRETRIDTLSFVNLGRAGESWANVGGWSRHVPDIHTLYHAPELQEILMYVHAHAKSKNIICYSLSKSIIKNKVLTPKL